MDEWNKNKAIHIQWLISTWCNYKCPYCPQAHNHNKDGKYYGFNYIVKRLVKKPFSIMKHINNMINNSTHSFNNYSPEIWAQSFERLMPQSISLTITGGEPFLDVQNFRLLLARLGEMDHIKCMRLDTNGSWNARTYKYVNWKNIYLNISYHPLMVKRDNFINHIKDKLDNGINISMVNYVLEPSQIAEFYIIKSELEKIHVYVHPNIYGGIKKQIEEGYNIYNKYIPEIDILLKDKQTSTKDKLCAYPCFSYNLHPTGVVNVSCFPSIEGNFIKGIIPYRFQNKIKCPADYCGCYEMYAFLDFVGRGKKLNLIEEYVAICKQKERG